MDLEDFLRLYNASDPDDQAQMLEEVKGAVTRARSTQTRALTSATKWVGAAKRNLDSQSVDDLVHQAQVVRATITALEEQTLKYVNICKDKKEREGYETDYHKRFEKADDILIEISDTIKDVKAFARGTRASAAASASAAAATPLATAALNPQDLKPPPLAYETSPTGFKAWQRDFDYYFDASKLAKETPKTQQGYLFACLSDKIKVELQSRITDDTPVLGPAGSSSCLATLSALWLKRHPRYNLRMSFVNAKQLPGETTPQMLDRLIELARDAEVDTMSTDDWLVHIALTAVTDKRVHARWMEAKEPTLADLRSIGENIESARAKTTKPQAEAASQAKVFAASSSKSNPTGKGTPSSSKSKKSSSSKPSKGSPAQCYQCGATNHLEKEQCPIFQRGLTCHKCGKMGHLQKVCRQGAPASQGGSGKSSHDATASRKK